MSSSFELRKPYALLAVIVCVGWIFFFFRSEYFELRDVDIQTSGGTVTEADVLPVVLNVLDSQSARPWSKRQIYFLPKQAIEEGIKNAFYAEWVAVGKTENNILRLNISFGSRFLYTTEKGDSFQRCTVARPTGTPVEDQTTLSVARKLFLATDFTTQSIDGLVYIRTTTSTLDGTQIKRLLELGKSFDDHKVKYAHFEERANAKVLVQLDKDRSALFDLNQPLNEQVDRCQSILRDPELQRLQPGLIDLTIPGRAYLR